MVWSGVDYLWIILMFYQLFGLSIWRHPFPANDPMVSKWCNAKFLQICSDKETNSSTSCIAWGRVHFQQIFIFGWTFPLSAKSGRTSSTPDRFWNVYDRPLSCLSFALSSAVSDVLTLSQLALHYCQSHNPSYKPFSSHREFTENAAHSVAVNMYVKKAKLHQPH